MLVRSVTTAGGGRVHTQAYGRVLHHFPELPLAPELVAVADEAPGRAEQAAETGT